MRLVGLTVTEVIAKLKELEDKGHGNAEVVVGGTDYPEGATSVKVNKVGNAYCPKGAVRIL